MIEWAREQTESLLRGLYVTKQGKQADEQAETDINLYMGHPKNKAKKSKKKKIRQKNKI